MRTKAQIEKAEKEAKIGMRKCSICGEEKELNTNNFHRDGSKYKAACKLCILRRMSDKNKLNVKIVKCKNCKCFFPLTDEYFNKGPRGRFVKKCRVCENLDSAVCVRCGIKQQLTEEFWYKNKEGFRSPCKICIKKQGSEYVMKNIEKVRESQRISQRKSYHKNPERHQENIRGYREKYKDEPEYKERISKQNKKHREKNKKNNRKLPETKICIGCSLEKPLTIDFFHKDYGFKDGFDKKCKICVIRDSKEYRENNREKVREISRKSSLKEKSENPEQIKNRRKKAYLRNKDKLESKLKWCVRSRIYHCLKESKGGLSVLKYLGYSMEDLKKHLESLFEPWMNWQNWGSYRLETWDDNDPSTWTWQIDHIIPHSELLYDSMEHPNFKKCWGMNNLRPLSAKQNVLDGTGRTRHSKKTA